MHEVPENVGTSKRFKSHRGINKIFKEGLISYTMVETLSGIMGKLGRDFERSNKKISKDFEINNKKFEAEFKKILSQKVTKSLAEEKRKPLKVSLKKQIFEKYKNKCSKTSCREKGEYNKPRRMEIHHVDMRAANDNPSNLKLYCRNHHKDEHDKYFRKKITKKDLAGNKIVVGSRIVKKKK